MAMSGGHCQQLGQRQLQPTIQQQVCALCLLLLLVKHISKMRQLAAAAECVNPCAAYMQMATGSPHPSLKTA